MTCEVIVIVCDFVFTEAQRIPLMSDIKLLLRNQFVWKSLFEIFICNPTPQMVVYGRFFQL